MASNLPCSAKDDFEPGSNIQLFKLLHIYFVHMCVYTDHFSELEGAVPGRGRNIVYSNSDRITSCPNNMQTEFRRPFGLDAAEEFKYQSRNRHGVGVLAGGACMAGIGSISPFRL